MKIILLIVTMLFFSGCFTHRETNPEIEKIVTQIAEMEKEYVAYEEKIKTSDLDQGRQTQLTHERELLKSRTERLKEKLKSLQNQ